MHQTSKSVPSFDPFILLCRYVSILVELTKIEGTKHGHLIASQMLDVAIRVKAIRSFGVQQMVSVHDGVTNLL